MIRALLAAVLALTLALGWSLWRSESHKGRAERAQEAVERTTVALNQTTAALNTERQYSKTLHEIGAKHEEDRRDAASVPDAVAADLRAGVVELQPQWAGCATDRLAASVASTIELDALARLREQDAGRLVQIGREADDQVRGLQAVILADREMQP